MRTMFKNLINYIHRGCQDKENSLRETLEQLNRSVSDLNEENQRKEVQIQAGIMNEQSLIAQLDTANKQLQELQQLILVQNKRIVSLLELQTQVKSQEAHIARARQEVYELRTSLHNKEQEEVKLRATIDSIKHEKIA